MPYQRIKRHLLSPRQIVHREILAEPVERLLRDCNIPEDPNWLSPTNYEEAEELMNRLPNWAKVVCAITAAEMVLPIWEDWAEDRNDLDNQEIEAPRRAIDAAQQWLDEEIDIVSAAYIDIAARAAGVAVGANADGDVDAYGASRAAYAAADAARAAGVAVGVDAGWAGAAPVVYAARAARAAARAARAAASHAIYAAMRAAVTDAAARAAARAAHAAAAAVYSNFYLDWWRVCRCRLSFILEARPF